MSDANDSADEIQLPIKRTEGDTMEERLTSNAHDNVLPARYLRKDSDGNLAEDQDELFARVGKNIALAEAVFESRKQDVDVSVTPAQLKPDHPRRDELAAEVFGAGTTADDDVETTLTERNVNKFAYETIVPELPDKVQGHVEQRASEFTDAMEQLSFMPNCVPPNSMVASGGGLKQLTDIEPGERVYDDEDGQARVESKFENGEKLVREITTRSGYTVRATPEHCFRVIAEDGNYEWRQLKNLRQDDSLALQKNFLDDDGSRSTLRPNGAADGGVVADTSENTGRPRLAINTPDRMTPALAEWLGLYVGSGTARESGVRVAFDAQDEDLVDYFQDLTDTIFGFEPTRRDRSDADCVIGQACRRTLYEFLDRNDLLKETSKTATIPPAVLESGRSCIARFLRGLFEADGTVGDRSIELYTHSESLAGEVQQSLLGLGIRSTVTPKRDEYRVTVRKNVCGSRFVDRVGFRSDRKQAGAEAFETVADNATSVKIPNQSERLHDWYQTSDLGHDAYRALSQFLIDPDSEYHQEIGVGIFRRYADEYPELWDSPVAALVERDQFYDSIAEISDVGRMAVEDMQVPRRNTYVVEGFVTHNSPSLMNAGDELQQLSACFVDSPDDDITDIHNTAKEAAEVFQCLTAETTVHVDGKGTVSIADVEPGDEIRQRDGDEFTTRRVAETHAYDDAPVHRVQTDSGIELTGTPNHELSVNGDWKRIDEIEIGDTLSACLGWLPETTDAPSLTSAPSGGQWDSARTVSTDAVRELHGDGLSDYQIAERLDCSVSTVQRRRANELELEPNGSGGRTPGSVSFDPAEFETLYQRGQSDREIASQLDVHTTTVGQYRHRQSLTPNGDPVKSVAQPSTLTPDLAELLGMWIGDGSKHEDGIRFHLNREENLEHVDHVCRRLFDEGLDWRFEDGCYDAVLHSHEVKRFWLRNFGDAKPDAPSAQVPEQIWDAGRETVAAFLRGLFSTDGSLQKDTYPRLRSASEDLVTEVQQLLVGLGMPALIWDIDSEEREQYNVGPTGERGLTAFSERVGFTDARDDDIAAALDRTSLQGTSVGTVCDDGVWEVPVTAVEDAGTSTVYDVTVADNHEYLANSVVSHNSGGGMGYAFWQLRPYGDPVGSTGGIASGPITFMRTYDQLCETIAQGGARRGAQMGVMRVSHPDVIQFIHAKNKDVSLANTLRLNDPDDFTHSSFADALDEARDLIDDDGKVPEHLRNAVEGHLSNFNISVGITDDFMTAVKNDEEFTFTNPRTEKPHIATAETKQLYDMYGLGAHVEVGETLSIPAAEIWEDIIEGAHENGEPGIIYLERVNKKHSFDVDEHPDHRILATNPCVTGDTLISTENGLIDAEELYQKGVAKDIVVDGRLSDDRVKEASSVYKTGEKDVYELSTEEGYSLRLTADHRVMTADGWVEAGNLDEGDTIHVQNRKGEFGQHGSAAEGRVLGWMVGDGHLKTGEERAVLNFYDEDAEVSESFAADVNDIVRNSVGNADYEVGVNEIARDDDYRGAQAVEQRVRSVRLYEYAEEAGLVDQKHQVPDTVMRGSEEMARGYLRGLFTADGSVQASQKNGRTVRLANTSLDLLKEVQQLLLNFGIASKIYEERRSGGKRELLDGKGGTKQYDTQGFHALVISKDNLVRFRDEVGFLLEYKNQELQERLDSHVRGPRPESFTATVESVEHDGNEDVFDLTEPSTQSFISNGIVVHNCGEQPLEEYEACNLGHINLSTLAAEDAPDWRVWSDEHGTGQLDDDVEAFLEEAIDWEEFDYRIDLGTRFLENVVTMSDFPVDEIERKVRELRKIGLGIMGLAQLYIQLGTRYGSEVANQIARQLMLHINHESKGVSRQLADERGNFAEWDKSKYADPTAFPEWFEHHTGEDPNNWADGFPIRNHNTTTIAPTGCVEENSLVSTDDGLRPIKDLDETSAEFEQWDEIEIGVTTDGGTKTATAVYDNGFADVRQIETEGGFNVAATPNHRFRTLTDDGRYAWKEADSFSPGDRIVLQRNTFDGGSRVSLDTSERANSYRNTDQDLVLPDEMTPTLAKFLGYFMGDGYVHDEVGVKLVVDSEATELGEQLRTLGERLFGVTPTVEDRDTRHMLTFGGRHLPRYFGDNGWTKDDGNHGEGAASAFIPEEILRGDEQIVKSFLRGLFEADGTASRKVELSTVSTTLADQVQSVLLSLGCVFVRDTLEMETREDHYGDRPRHSVRGANRREDKRFADEIGFMTKSTDFDMTAQSYKPDTYPPSVVEHLRALDGYDSVSKPVKSRVNQSPINGAVSRKLVQDVEKETGETVTIDGRELTEFYVATTESVTEETAYTKDISVPSNNTYVADGFVTHNTTSMIGNTTGGCEPIYNVAYYKNVSGDVQGDEMLVEFDDYFLRTLEANDIDVTAVKKEAQEQMSTNEFDGVDGLETVPNAIGELFVVTGDLDAQDHAGVQVACQAGVDSAISKCLEEGTLVQTDSGVRPIESFADELPAAGEFAAVEDRVTIDGVPVESQYYAGEKAATRVRVDNGTEMIGATDSHKVLTPDGWAVLGELEAGDYVVGRRQEGHGDGAAAIPFGRFRVATDGAGAVAADEDGQFAHEKTVHLPDEMSAQLARFLGMYAADGSAIEERYSVEICTSSARVREEARELFADLFDREPFVERDTRHGDQRETVYNVGLNSKPVWELVTRLCDAGAYTKTVAETVLRGSRAEKLAFLNGVTLDGYVTGQSLVVYGGMSRDLADGVAALLRSFGLPKVYVGRKWVDESEAYAYSVHVTNEAQELVTPIEPHKRVEQFDQRYRVHVPQDAVDKTDFDSRSSEYYAARTFEQRGRNYMFNTTAEKLGVTDAPPLYEVTETEDAGTREMYDIELAGPHEYVVGGLVSHNTVNAPNDSTLADAKEAFEYIYDHGGKGVTYYRDGTRSKQVLTTRAQNTEFSDEDEAIETIVEGINEVFGGLETFLENEAVQQQLDAEVSKLLDAADRGPSYADTQPRPDTLSGVTQRVETGYGKLYVTVNEDDDGKPFELFANIGHSGGYTNSFTEALAKVISTALRSGVDPVEIVDELHGTRSPKVAWDKGEQIQSIPDAIGTALRRYLDDDVDKGIPQQQSLSEVEDVPSADDGAVDADGSATEPASEADTGPDSNAQSPTKTDGGAGAAASGPATQPGADTGPSANENDAMQDLIAAGESPECPDCGGMELHYSEGCKTCQTCGWSEC